MSAAEIGIASYVRSRWILQGSFRRDFAYEKFPVRAAALKIRYLVPGSIAVGSKLSRTNIRWVLRLVMRPVSVFQDATYLTFALLSRDSKQLFLVCESVSSFAKTVQSRERKAS